MQLRRSAYVAHPVQRMFALIEAAEHYPSFLPWCEKAEILQRDDDMVVARLSVAWHGARFAFVTRNPKRAPHWMAIGLAEGPFRRFAGEWQLDRIADWGCRIQFALDYELSAGVLDRLTGRLFDNAVNTMVDAFVQRADQIQPNEDPKP
jgi:ribosome-associated toxin RatA of RatAB toxin-antitoxin module